MHFLSCTGCTCLYAHRYYLLHIHVVAYTTIRPDVPPIAGVAVPDTMNGYDDTTMLPSETFDSMEMMFHWARYNMTEAQKVFGLTHAETIVTLSGAHTVGHSEVHKSSPTSLGTRI
jgi:hypothetical protein